MQQPANALTLQFLAWIAERPRNYGETMEAWRSTCPRLSIWEDAILDGLIQIENAGGRPRNEAIVTVTARGRAVLQAHSDSVTPPYSGAVAAE